MSAYEIRLLEAQLLALKCPELDILEWGCGGSTGHFTSFLRKHSIDYHWTSVEHHKGWYEKIAESLRRDPAVEVHFCPIHSNEPDAEENAIQAYVDFPDQLGRRYDFILVDGRHRKRCLKKAKSLLKPHGIVCIHDALRPRYHAAFDEFLDGRFISLKIWRGSLYKPSWLRRAANRCNYFYYRWIVKRLYHIYRRTLRRLGIEFDYRTSRW